MTPALALVTLQILATAHVTYVAGGSVYVDAGRTEGVAVGDTVLVVRGGAPTAWLTVAFASSHRASCDTLRTTAPPVVGDEVQYTPRAAVSDSLQVATAARAPEARRGSRWIHGRVGLRYLDLGMSASGAGRYRQVALDLRAEGTGGGGRSDVAVDVRTHHASRAVTIDSTNTASVSRVYRASYSLHTPSGSRRVTVGRQSAPVLSSVSTFDGLLAETGGARSHVGAFVGTQPEPIRMGLSGEIVEFGVYGELHQRALAPTRWSVAAGAISSQHSGEPNRDFLFLQGHVITRTVSGSWTQELDVNRGWKRDAGEPALALTSTFVAVRAQASTAASVNAGYDNRRSVRLYRDALTPETDFDDRYRQGAWAGASYVFGRRAILSGDVRMNRTGPDDHAHSWTVSGDLLRVAPMGAGLRVRVSRYAGMTAESRLSSASLRADPLSRLHVEVAGGSRTTSDLTVNVDETETWVSGSADLTVGSRWFLNGSLERDSGDTSSTTQLLLGASMRF